MSEGQWATPVAVFFVACLLSPGKPTRLSFSFFSSASAFEHRTPHPPPPPKLHIPALWFHGTGQSPPCHAGRLPADSCRGTRWEHKLTAEEQDTRCIFLRPGIQLSFRGCIFFNSSLKIEQNISGRSYFLITSFPLRGCIESQKLESGKDILDHV